MLDLLIWCFFLLHNVTTNKLKFIHTTNYLHKKIQKEKNLLLITIKPGVKCSLLLVSIFCLAVVFSLFLNYETYFSWNWNS